LDRHVLPEFFLNSMPEQRVVFMDIRPALTEIQPCRHGIMFWPKQDQVIGKALMDYGEFAEGENIVMSRYLRAGDVAVDVGANVGTTALAMAQQVGPQGHVIALEPQPVVAHCLAAALAANGLSQVRLLTVAAGQQSGMVKMDFSQPLSNHGTAKVASQGDSVPMIRLDDLELARCALIKIDVEGYEWQVIEGARATIGRLRPTLYFEAKRLPGTEAAMGFLLQHGYRLYWHFSFFFRADNFRNKAENAFQNLGDMNVLAVPDTGMQPADLPEIQSATEDWQKVYVPFFQSRGLKMV
jgi:FkbM family methyltransferase